MRVLEYLQDVELYELKLEEAIEVLSALPEKYPAFSDFFLTTRTSYYNDIELMGYRQETEKEKKKRLSVQKRKRERKKKAEEAKKEREIKELERLKKKYES